MVRDEFDRRFERLRALFCFIASRFALLFLLAFVACSEASPTPAPIIDGSPPDAAGVDANGADVGVADAPVDAPACNALDFADAPAVVLMQVPSNAPAAAGGTVVPGIYFMTQYSLYTRPGGASGPLPLSLRVRYDFTADTLDAVEASDGDSRVLRYTSSYATSGTQLTMTRTCRGTLVETASYTATATSITISATDQGMVVEGVFTKR